MVGLVGEMRYKVNTDINIMEDNLSDGERGEILLVKKLNSLSFIQSAMRIESKQREGIDGVLEFRGEKYTWDAKIRDNFYYRYNDILIETKTGGKVGWFYYSHADMVFYCWWNKEKRDIIDGYIIPLQSSKLRNWFEKNKDFYNSKEAYSQNSITLEYWKTQNKVIPISDFPKGIIIRLKIK